MVDLLIRNPAQLEATIQADRSMVDNSKLQLSYTKITSPLNGLTGLRLVDAGNMIRATDPSGLVVITQIDPIAVLDLQEIIFALKKSGIGVLITDHNVRETLSVTDRAYIITEGKIFAAGTPGELGRNPDVRRIYLGENFSMD